MDNPLYNEVILELQKDETFFRKGLDTEYSIEAYNRLCGDKFTLFVDYSDNIEKIAFYGYGCALARASTALLVEHMQHKTWEEAGRSCAQVLDFFQEGAEMPPLGDERFRAFEPVRTYTARYKCVALSWQSMLAHCYQQIKSGAGLNGK